MSNPSEEFSRLRQALKLKRHEQPPPRYFNEFSSQVVNRLRETQADKDQEIDWSEAPWLRRFLHYLESNSLAAVGFAGSICALLIGGIVYSEYSDSPATNLTNNNDGNQMVAQRNPAPVLFGDAPADAAGSNALQASFGASVGGPVVVPVSLKLGGQ